MQQLASVAHFCNNKSPETCTATGIRNYFTGIILCYRPTIQPKQPVSRKKKDALLPFYKKSKSLSDA
jgi:hypothetical protein